MPRKINGKFCFFTSLALMAMAEVAPSAWALGPVIIRHDAQLMEREIRINLAWQSDEPVMKIIASAGKEPVVITNDINNERNEGGYSGEVDVVVPAYPLNSAGEQSVYMSRQSSSQFQQSSMEMHSNSSTPYSEVVQYTVQLVDEVNQRSTLLKDKVHRSEPVITQPIQKLSSQSPATAVMANGKDSISAALNTTLGLIGKIGQAPEIKNMKINTWSENRTSISFEATDDKGVDRIIFEVRDVRGDSIYQNIIVCNAEKTCTKQSDSFILNSGKYMLSASAIDTDSNGSKKMEQEFQVISNPSGQLPPIQSASPTATPSPQQQTVSPPAGSSAPGVIYEDQ